MFKEIYLTFSVFKVNAVYLEQCIDKLSEEELMDVKVQVTKDKHLNKTVT